MSYPSFIDWRLESFATPTSPADIHYAPTINIAASEAVFTAAEIVASDREGRDYVCEIATSPGVIAGLQGCGGDDVESVERIWERWLLVRFTSDTYPVVVCVGISFGSDLFERLVSAPVDIRRAAFVPLPTNDEIAWFDEREALIAEEQLPVAGRILDDTFGPGARIEAGDATEAAAVLWHSGFGIDPSRLFDEHPGRFSNQACVRIRNHLNSLLANR